RSRLDVAERLDEVERDHLVLDRVDEAIAQPVPDAEDLVEPREPRPALAGRAACEEREVDRRAAGRDLAEPVEAAGREQLPRRREHEPRRPRDAVALARERDREVRLARGDIGLEQRGADVLPVFRGGERQLALEVLRHEQGGLAAYRLPSLLRE